MGRKAKQGAAKKVGRDEKLAAPAGEGASSLGGEGGGTGGGTPGLPKANLVRLMRQVIPKSAKISSRAKDLTHDCAVEFVGFLAGEAGGRATAQHRRTIAPEDFTASFQELGFDDYVGPMTTYISRYREQANPAGYRGVARLPPRPPVATVAAAVTAPPPCVSDEETHTSPDNM